MSPPIVSTSRQKSCPRVCICTHRHTQMEGDGGGMVRRLFLAPAPRKPNLSLFPQAAPALSFEIVGYRVQGMGKAVLCNTCLDWDSHPTISQTLQSRSVSMWGRSLHFGTIWGQFLNLLESHLQTQVGLGGFYKV